MQGDGSDIQFAKILQEIEGEIKLEDLALEGIEKEDKKWKAVQDALKMIEDESSSKSNKF